jgi:hypothetical protein
MPIIPKNQTLTFDEKIERINKIISKQYSEFDKQLLKNFIYELCQRYIDKSKELEKYVSPQISEMEKYERAYFELILKDMV